MAEHRVPQTRRIAVLADAYTAAHYRALIGTRQYRFRVGRRATGIERNLIAAGYLFITAWNPASRRLGAKANREAGERLQRRLDQDGYVHHPAFACDGAGDKLEHGRLVLDMPTGAADALASEFGQLGTLCWRHGQPVRLRMLAAPPPGLATCAGIDWVG